MRYLLASVALFACCPLRAATDPSYAPAPAWTLPALPVAAPGQDNRSPILLVDGQVMLGTDSSAFYTEIVTRNLSERSLRGEPIVLPFNPDRQDLVIHKVAVIRGGETIDLLAKGQRFFTIRRETNLEAAALDGVLTAVLQPEGLQDGDLVDVAFTVIDRRASFGGRPDNMVVLPPGFSPVQYRSRTIWPKDMVVAVRGAGLFKDVKPRTAGDVKEVSISLSSPRMSALPKDAPARALFNDSFQVSAYASWAEVGALLAPAFDKAATIDADSPLRAEVERIKAATPDPARRAMLALRLVQDQVRYLLLAMDGGDYIPAAADQTWSRRFGDCKGKTALLIALLRALDIPATPILVRSAGGDAMAGLLPTLKLFDHVIVRAEIGGTAYWLDGTRVGDRDLAELKSFPFGMGLPIQAQGAAPFSAPYLPPLQPVHDWTVRIDARDGLTLPAPTRMEYLVRGSAAAYLNTNLTGASRDDSDKYLKDLIGGLVDGYAPAEIAFSYNADAALLRITGKGVTTLDWQHPLRVVGRRLTLEQDTVRWNVEFERKPEQKDLPFAFNPGVYLRGVEEIRLPGGGKGFSFEGEKIDLAAAGATIRRDLSLDGDTARQVATFRLNTTEIPAATALADKPAIKAANDKRAYLVAPAGYVDSDKETAEALAKKPEDADGYSDRALSLEAVGRWAEARADFTKAIELAPNDAWHYGNRAITQFWLGHVPEAKADAEKSLAIAANLPAHNAMGLILTLAGDLDGAIASFTSALEIRPDSIFSLEKRAKVRLAKRDWTEAAADLDAIEKLGGDESELWRLRSSRHRMMGDLPAALADIDHIAIRPDEEPAIRTRRARLLRAMGRAAEADAETVKAKTSLETLIAKAPPEDRDAARAVTYDDMGLHAEALALLDRLIARKDSGQLLNARCWSYATLGTAAELPKALKDCDGAIERVVGFTAALDSRGLVKLKMGALDGAIADFDAALRDQPTLSTSLYGRGLARLRKGDAGGTKDLLIARAMAPDIDDRFASFGLRPDEGAKPATPAPSPPG